MAYLTVASISKLVTGGGAAASWTILILASAFIFGVSFALFLFGHSFGVAAYSKMVDIVKEQFRGAVTLYVTSAAAYTGVVVLALFMHYLARGSIRMLFVDFRLGTRGYRSLAICLLATACFLLLFTYVVDTYDALRLLVVNWVEKLQDAFTSWFKTQIGAYLEPAVATGFIMLFLVYAFLTPLLVRALGAMGWVADVGRAVGIGAGLGIAVHAISIPLAETAYTIIEKTFTEEVVKQLGIFAAIVVVVLIFTVISEVRERLLAMRWEYLVHLPPLLWLLNKLMPWVVPHEAVVQVVGLLYVVSVLFTLAVYAIGIIRGDRTMTACASAVWPGLLYIELESAT